MLYEIHELTMLNLRYKLHLTSRGVNSPVADGRRKISREPATALL
jgi:hypothetical protein